ncbi:MAG: hypothetical protein NTV81_02805 [Candidatus Komeilibacteria bacterium]|nr:hypothetical protein [Candidatus Komeilibacteria bacterium]
MLETSKDLLYIVLAFCILWLTIFLCWLIYYLTLTIKRWYEAIDRISRFFESMHSLVERGKNKVENSVTAVLGLAEIGKKLFDTYQAKRSKKTKSKS